MSSRWNPCFCTTVMAVLAPAPTTVKPAKQYATTTTIAPWSSGVSACKGGSAFDDMSPIGKDLVKDQTKEHSGLHVPGLSDLQDHGLRNTGWLRSGTSSQHRARTSSTAYHQGWSKLLSKNATANPSRFLHCGDRMAKLKRRARLHTLRYAAHAFWKDVRTDYDVESSRVELRSVNLVLPQPPVFDFDVCVARVGMEEAEQSSCQQHDWLRPSIPFPRA
jgi:hypothetical protein